jgi:hypothetical protein
MANYCYLCCSNWAKVYPSRLRGYSAEANTVACDVWSVPLLWLAGFRKGDLKKSSVTLDGERTSVVAPLASTESFVAALTDRLAVLQQALSGGDALEEWASFLVKAIRSTSGSQVTVEWVEIEDLTGPQAFRADVRRILEFLDHPEAEIERARELRAQENALPTAERLRLLRSAFPQFGLDEVRKQLRASGDLREAYRSLAAKRSHLEVVRDESYWSNTYCPAPDIGDLLRHVTGVRIEEPLSTVAAIRTGAAPEEARVQVARLLGVAHYRPVPWASAEQSA